MLLLFEKFSWIKVGILFERISDWINIKDNMKKYLRLKGIEIRVEKEFFKLDDFDVNLSMYKFVIK